MAQTFRPNRAYPTIPTITGSIESHTVALKAMAEAIGIHERRTRDLDNSFVRVSELVDLGLITLVNGQFNTIGIDLSQIAMVGDLSGATEGDFLRFRSGVFVNDVLFAVDILEVFVTQHEAALTIAFSQLTGVPAFLLSVVAGTGISVNNASPQNPIVSLSVASVASLLLADSAVQPADLDDVATSGDYNDLINTPVLADVATSGDYNDLINAPAFVPERLDDLLDVDASYPDPRDTIAWDGTFWVNTPLDFEPIRTETSSYAVALGDRTVISNAAGAPITVLLPALSGSLGRVITVKKVDATANAVTLDASSSETIDGALTRAITTQYESVTIQASGTEWHII